MAGSAVKSARAIELHLQGKSPIEIAVEIGCSQRYVSTVLRAALIDCDLPRREKARLMRYNGFTLDEIAIALQMDKRGGVVTKADGKRRCEQCGGLITSNECIGCYVASTLPPKKKVAIQVRTTTMGFSQISVG